MDAGTADEQLTVVSYDGGELDQDGGPTPIVVERFRGFGCEPIPPGVQTTIADVDGVPGATVAIESVGDCFFSLLLRTADDLSTTVLSSQPKGYLFADAVVRPDGSTLVCASAINHSISATLPGAREIDSVELECWHLDVDGSVRTASVVPPDPEYAAWLDGIVLLEQASAFAVLWTRDFSFQFLNMSDLGRPPTDGTYESIVVSSPGALSVASTQMVSPSVLGEQGVVLEDWVPTPEEVELLGPHMDLPTTDAGVPDAG